MDGLEFRILGPVEVSRDGVAVPVTAGRQRAVLAALLLHANRVVATERLVTLVWGDDPPETVRNTLQSLVRRLRRLLASPGAGRFAQPLLTRPPGYLLRVEPERVDLCRFEKLVRRAREALAGDQAATAGALLAEAVGLWRGPALADVAADELRRTEGARLEEWYWQAVEDRLEAELRQGRHVESIGELRRLVAEHPLRERPYGQLMRALHRSGRLAEALDTYQTLRRTLIDQLGVEPGQPVRLLHQAMLRDSPDPEAAGPPPPATGELAAPAQLPSDTAIFTGRGVQLAYLDSVLAATRRSAAVPVVAVVGMPGVGKTALVVHWAHRVRGHFPDGQLHVDLGGYATAAPLRPIDALARFLRALNVPPAAVPVVEPEATAWFRTLLADRRVLVVLDNARGADQVRPLLPGGPGCLVLVTSRDRLDGLVAREDAHRLTLDTLPPSDAQTLLVRGIGAQVADREPEAVVELARRCGHLPLALRLAAANLHARRDGVAAYAARLAAGDPLTGLAVVGDDQSTVRTAFQLSFATLPGEAARLFRLLGVLPGADIPVAGAAALAGVSTEDAGRLLDRLAAAHLVHEPVPGRFTCHDLLRGYAAGLAAGTVDGATARDRLYDWYLAAADAAARLLHPERLRMPSSHQPGVTPDGWDEPAAALSWLDAERANLVAIARNAAREGPRRTAWLLADALRGYLSLRGHLVEWDSLCHSGLAAAEAEGELTAQAAMRSGLAELHWRRKRHRTAIAINQAAVDLSQLAGWPAGTAGALGNLGMIHRDLGDSEAAIACHTRALALNRGQGRLAGQAANLGNLGIIHWELDQLDHAMECFAEALRHYQRLGSASGQATTLVNLADVCLALGQETPAQAHLTAALDLFPQVGRCGDEAEALRLLAEVHHAAGRLGPARKTAYAAIDLARETSARRVEALASHTLGGIELSAGRTSAAVAGQREALRLARATGTPYPEGLAHLGLATIYRRCGDVDRAGAHAGRVLTLARAHGYRALEDRAAALLTGPPPPPGTPRTATPSHHPS